MFLSIKLLSLFFLIFGVIGGLFRSRIFRVWFFLELSTISFLLNLIITAHKVIVKETIKLFLIQSLSGMRILLFILLAEETSSSLIRLLIWLIVLFKISAVPFHSWFLNLRNKISWERILLFLTIIKFLPLIVLSYTKRNYSVFFRIFSFTVAALRRGFYSRMKNLIVLSSLFFLGILFYTIEISNFWIEIILIYTFIFCPLFLIFRNESNSLFIINWFGGASTFIVFTFIIRLAGLPPFPGFFLKYIWLLESKIDFISLIVFFIGSGFIIYLYIRFSLKNLLEFSNQLVTYSREVKINFLVLWIIVIPAFISVYFGC